MIFFSCSHCVFFVAAAASAAVVDVVVAAAVVITAAITTADSASGIFNEIQLVYVAILEYHAIDVRISSH